MAETTEQCSHCKGVGKVYWDHPDLDRPWAPNDKGSCVCPDCDGTGGKSVSWPPVHDPDFAENIRDLKQLIQRLHSPLLDGKERADAQRLLERVRIDRDDACNGRWSRLEAQRLRSRVVDLEFASDETASTIATLIAERDRALADLAEARREIVRLSSLALLEMSKP